MISIKKKLEATRSHKNLENLMFEMAQNHLYAWQILCFSFSYLTFLSSALLSTVTV